MGKYMPKITIERVYPRNGMQGNEEDVSLRLRVATLNPWFPPSYVRECPFLLPTEQKVRAANGTAIDLKGKDKYDAQTGKFEDSNRGPGVRTTSLRG